MKKKSLFAWLRQITAVSIVAVSLPSARGDVPGLVHDIRSGPSGYSSDVTNLCKVGSTLYFTRRDPTLGQELWKSGGTSATTVRVKDVFPGFMSSNPSNLTAVGSTLY